MPEQPITWVAVPPEARADPQSITWSAAPPESHSPDSSDDEALAPEYEAKTDGWAAWSVADDAGPLALGDDPLAAVAANDAHQRADVPDGAESGLWTADQLHAAGPRAYRFVAPTFAPRHWATAARINQAEYTARFAKEFPEVQQILPMVNVCVAGGAAAWPLGEAKRADGDIDFFLYGLPADDSAPSRAARWNCVEALVGRIRAQFDQCVETLTPGLVAIRAWRKEDQSRVSLQIILRAYPTVSSIVHGFDVPACCVAFDGHVAVMTQLAAFAHMFRANVVVPAYRSTTYERRLLKYFERGFALVLPHLRGFADASPIRLPNLTLLPAVVRGRFAAGTAALSALQPASDYEPGESASRNRYVSAWRDGDTARYGQDRINLRKFATGKPLVLMAVAGVARHRRRRNRWGQDIDETGLPFATFRTMEPTRASVFPREQFEAAISAATRAIVSRKGHVNVSTLRAIFGLDADQIGRLAAAANAAATENPRCRVDLSPSLAPFHAALIAKYAAGDDAIAWWILADPARQHTASLNPRCEEPAQWYGDMYAAELKAPTVSEQLETVIGAQETMRETQGIAFDGVCSLCHEDVRRGDVNSITLACGHVFHWAAENGPCGGLCTWVTMQNNTCPVCRAPFAPDLGSDDESEAPPPSATAVNIML